MNGGLAGGACGRARYARWCMVLLGGWLTAGLAGCAAAIDDGADDDGSVAREIEEADIVKFVDGYFYLANPYTGLRIVDARDMDAPVLAGRLPLGGRGVELIVRDDHALVFTAADFGWCAGEPVDYDDPQYGDVLAPGYTGSRLWVIDVADRDEPALVTTIGFDGYIVGTRRVGDILYAAGNVGDSVFVTSIDIADPAAPRVVENQQYTGSADDMHVSAEAIYLFGDDPAVDQATTVSYIDISSTNGVITRRDTFRVPGYVENRYFMDATDDTLRIVTEEFESTTFTTVVALYTYDVSNPDVITRRAKLPIVTNESLRSVRFDGERGYAVTFFQVDPLFVLDLSDPDAPQLSGELTVPGFSTHLVPLGDRLLGVGFNSGGGAEPTVALYDVQDPDRPRQLKRIVLDDLGLSGASSEATVDEKALGVLPEAGLVLLPYAVFDRDTGEFTDGLQLISLGNDTLQARGRITHRGIVRRSGVADERLWMVSDLAFSSVDITNLAAPAALADLELISEQDLLDLGLLDCVDSARVSGQPVFFDGGGAFCGSLLGLPFLLIALGLGVMKFWRRR